MIATWMLYCLLAAGGLSVAAVVAERALLAGRGPVRLVWISAVLLSVVIPIVAFRIAPRPSAVEIEPMVMQSALTQPFFEVPVDAPPPPAIAPAASGRRPTLSSLNGPLAIAWITLSLALGLNFLGGMVTLAWMRRRWDRRIVHGLDVYVSARTGPAVVGVLSPAIVIPEWVLALEPKQLSLLLRHEQEHQRAGDGLLLTAAELTLIAMPWNLALWWQVVRLRGAVELDCDARVLENADEREYGDLLLEVARPRNGPRLMGSTAFAERATQLERRILVLSRHRVHTTRTARIIAACIGVIAITTAWAAPRPSAPARAAEPAPSKSKLVGVPTPPVVASQPHVTSAAANVTPEPNNDTPMRSLAARTVATTTTRRPPVLPRITKAPCVRTGGRSVPAVVDTIFDHLFEGVPLTPAQESQACNLLARMQLQQSAADEAANAELQTIQTRTQAIRTQRDSALRTIVTNEADRVTLDTRLALMASGTGRGAMRSGGPGFETGYFSRSDTVNFRASGRAVVGGDTLVYRVSGVGARGGRGGAGDTTTAARVALRGGRGGGGVIVDTTSAQRQVTRRGMQVGDTTATAGGRGARRGGGGGGGGGARGGRGGADPAAAAALVQTAEQMNEMVNQLTFRRLFEGIALTPDQESAAREVLSKAQQDMRMPRPRPETILRFNRVSGMVSMQAESVAALSALVNSDADRTKLQSRIVINEP
jgi:hypothetical protein